MGTKSVNLHAGIEQDVKEQTESILSEICISAYHRKDYISEGELLRFTQLYNYYSKNPNKINMLTNTIKESSTSDRGGDRNPVPLSLQQQEEFIRKYGLSFFAQEPVRYDSCGRKYDSCGKLFC